MSLASRFAPQSPILRSDRPLSDDRIRAVVPSIFADAPHGSRSDRYAYIPTSTVLTKLRQEGFEPFMVCQTRVRNEDRREYTKHLIRLRHASQINGDEANEIILLNSHDGTSSYQMLAGMFRFVCHNGLVCGDTTADIRVPHKGDVASQVIEGAYGVLEGFERVQNARDAMLALKYDDPAKSTPVTESQLLAPRRWDDRKNDLWAVFNRVQENLVKGGLNGRKANGRNQRTRPVQGIDQNLRLNRALWLLAEGMRQLNATRTSPTSGEAIPLIHRVPSAARHSSSGEPSWQPHRLPRNRLRPSSSPASSRCVPSAARTARSRLAASPRTSVRSRSKTRSWSSTPKASTTGNS